MTFRRLSPSRYGLFPSRSTIASTGETQLRFAVRANVVERTSASNSCYPDTAAVLPARQVDEATVTHQFVEEAEVEQVHDGVFNATDVDVCRQPVVCCIGIQHAFFFVLHGRV